MQSTLVCQYIGLQGTLVRLQVASHKQVEILANSHAKHFSRLTH